MTDEPLAATKERLGAYDAIESAKPDEPLFPIQGGDPFGPPTVLHWAHLARASAVAETDEKKALHLLRKASDAEAVAWLMLDYQRGEQEQEADRASYNALDVVADDAEMATRKSRISGAERLNDIVGRLADVTEALSMREACPVETGELREIAAPQPHGAQGWAILQVEPMLHRECALVSMRHCPSLKRDILCGTLRIRQVRRWRAQVAIMDPAYTGTITGESLKALGHAKVELIDWTDRNIEWLEAA